MKSKLTIGLYGTKEWKHPNSGVWHREDGPAVEYSYGDKEWYINGKLHRKNGPAIEYSDGSKSWFINGIQYSEQEYKYKTRSKKLDKLLK
jgi:hypothetical protein